MKKLHNTIKKNILPATAIAVFSIPFFYLDLAGGLRYIVILFALFFILGVCFLKYNKYKQKKNIKKYISNQKKLLENKQALKKQGLRPFKVKKRTVWAKSYKEAQTHDISQLKNGI